MPIPLTPYEIWITQSGTTSEAPLVTWASSIGLDDTAAKADIVAILQAIIAKINDPTPDTLEVRKGLISPNQYNVRVGRRDDILRNS